MRVEPLPKAYLFSQFKEVVNNMIDKDNWSVGGIEAGGTKVICIIGRGPNEILAEETIQTTSPDETIDKIKLFFRKQSENQKLLAIGIASFGPIDLQLDSKTYGFITNTPKPGWAFTDVVGEIREEFSVPIGFNTDVNGAAYGEFCWGAGQGLDTILYLTVGTGIGGGAVIGKKIISGLLHPEMGHVRIPHDHIVDPFMGICPYHGDCLEGLASGPAIAARWKCSAISLPPDHTAWDLEANYIAYALVNYTLTISPQKLILGGGVMNQSQLFPKIRERYLNLLNNYIQIEEITARINTFITPPGLGSYSGVLGALALGLDLVKQETT